ncbi:hypothetical protein [Nocardia nova]|uniref:hypothetical protein n=1 Tax=Nocardia nova TaxID=37330 RepID=UPI0033C85CFF
MAGTHVKVDVDALQAMATKLKGSAGVIGNKKTDLAAHSFGQDQAGKDYGTEGKKVHDSLERLQTWLSNWQTAIQKTGEQMASSANLYATTDDGNVEKIKASI